MQLLLGCSSALSSSQSGNNMVVRPRLLEQLETATTNSMAMTRVFMLVFFPTENHPHRRRRT
jgi:hypothetical protein